MESWIEHDIGAMDYAVFAGLIESISGINLGADKVYLLKNRLGPLLHSLGCNGYMDLYRQAKSDGTGIIRSKIIDAISTNETYFFREKEAFDLLTQKLLPEHLNRQTRLPSSSGASFSILSAACSTGQEPYSLAMAIHEFTAHRRPIRVHLVATDISDSALSVARTGIYETYQVDRGLTPDQKERYFARVDERFHLNPQIRSMVQFRKTNLLAEDGITGLYDIIYCRNVAIYFSDTNRRKLFERIATHLRPNGVLVIGSTESLFGVTERFQYRDFRGSGYYSLVSN